MAARVPPSGPDEREVSSFRTMTWLLSDMTDGRKIPGVMIATFRNDSMT